MSDPLVVTTVTETYELPRPLTRAVGAPPSITKDRGPAPLTTPLSTGSDAGATLIRQVSSDGASTQISASTPGATTYISIVP